VGESIRRIEKENEIGGDQRYLKIREKAKGTYDTTSNVVYLLLSHKVSVFQITHESIDKSIVKFPQSPLKTKPHLEKIGDFRNQIENIDN